MLELMLARMLTIRVPSEAVVAVLSAVGLFAYVSLWLVVLARGSRHDD